VATHPTSADAAKRPTRRTQPRVRAATSKTAAPAENPRLCLVGAKVSRGLRSEIDAYAQAHGLTRSKAAGEFLAIASETLRERQGVPVGRADDILEALEGVRAVVETLGPPTFAVLRLLAHWACKTDLKLTEDELLAELRSVGGDEWEQAVTEAERSLQEVPGEPPGARSE
jgi:hypothetical protein